VKFPQDTVHQKIIEIHSVLTSYSKHKKGDMLLRHSVEGSMMHKISYRIEAREQTGTNAHKNC